MYYRVKLRPRAEKDLENAPNPYRKRILVALVNLSKNPFAGKKLEGEYCGCYSMRVWPYRIIYKVYKNELLVIVIRIGHRQGVYSLN